MSSKPGGGGSSYDHTTIVKSGAFMAKIQEAIRKPACVVMLEGPAAHVGQQWPITGKGIVIGRSMDSAIFIDDRSVSKSHATLALDDAGVSIVDLESTNRTIVNGEALQPLVPVRLGKDAQIKVGDVLFKFLEAGSLEANALERLHTKSEKDPMTGAYNKGALNQKAAESFKRAKVLGVPMCLAVFDIDHFKKINDTYGHSAGDHVLKELVGVIGGGLIRPTDFFARYGGEEFVLLLGESTAAQGFEVGLRICRTIEAHVFEFEGARIPTTVSVGIAHLEPSMGAWEEMFTKADLALYRAKRGGRNRVEASA